MAVSEHGREAQGPFPGAQMAETVEPEGRDSKAPAGAETPGPLTPTYPTPLWIEFPWYSKADFPQGQSFRISRTQGNSPFQERGN